MKKHSYHSKTFPGERQRYYESNSPSSEQNVNKKKPFYNQIDLILHCDIKIWTKKVKKLKKHSYRSKTFPGERQRYYGSNLPSSKQNVYKKKTFYNQIDLIHCDIQIWIKKVKNLRKNSYRSKVFPGERQRYCGSNSPSSEQNVNKKKPFYNQIDLILHCDIQIWIKKVKKIEKTFLPFQNFSRGKATLLRK